MFNSNMLSGLIELLEDKIGYDFDVDSFESRLELQKYVYLVRYFSDDLKYSFNLYAHGPYSPSLAGEYYSINRDEVEMPKIREQFFELINDKDAKWLELASTILLYRKQNRSKSDVVIIRKVKSRKSWSTVEEIQSIIEELKKVSIF